MEKYYLNLDNEQKGPFTIGQLQAMWLADTIDPNTQFYTKANGDWKKLEAILDLLEPFPSPAWPVGAAVAPVIAENPVWKSPVPSPAPEAAAPIPRAPAGLGRCPECGGLGGHLAGCSAGTASTAPGVSPLAAATAAKVATMPPPSPQEWRDRMAVTAMADNPGGGGNRPVHKSFPVLDFFSMVMRGLGWIVFIISVIWALVSLTTTHSDNVLHLLMILMPPIGVMAMGILFIVLGEVIGVVFSIEENTFKSASSLDNIAKSMRLLGDISRKTDKQG